MSRRKGDFASIIVDLLGDIGNEAFQMGVKMVTGQRTKTRIGGKKIDKDLREPSGIPIGNIVGSKHKLMLPVTDARHKIVQGATRMGKTEWAINYVVNRAKKNQGTAFLDNADGSAAQKILNGLPEKCLSRCVVLDHSDKYHPLPIGLVVPSTSTNQDSTIFVQDDLVSLWLSFFVDNLGVEGQWMTQELIQNACKAAFAAFGHKATLLEIIQIASDPIKRAQILRWLDPNMDADVLEWWNRFEDMSGDKQRFTVESFMRRAGVITTQRVLQHMLCQIPRNPYPYRKWIDEGYTVLIICKESMGSLPVRIVMSMHLLNFWLSAMSRDEELPENAPRKPFVIVADEPQTWLPGNETILDNLYSKGLKYGLGIISMFQSTAQVAERSPKLLEKMFDNQPDLIFFRTNKSVIDIPGFKLSEIKKHHFVAKIGDYPPVECRALPMVKPIERRNDYALEQLEMWGTHFKEVSESIKSRRRGYADHGERQSDYDVLGKTQGGDSDSNPQTIFPLIQDSSTKNANDGARRLSTKTSTSDEQHMGISILSLDDGEEDNS